MKNSIFVFLFFGFLVTPVLLFGQTKISFHYDYAGNRTERIIELKKDALALSDSTAISLLTDQLGQVSISIFPNPTKGIVTVNITNPPVDKPVSCAVFNPEGKRLHFIDSQFQSDKIELSSYPNGIYVLVITVDNKKSEWKIIKE